VLAACVGPVTPAGFGVGYIIKDNGVAFCVTSKHRQTDRYCASIKRFMEVRLEWFRTRA
jgi:carnitine O-acetyltransferase